MSGVELKGFNAMINKIADRQARMQAAHDSAVFVGVLGSAGSDLVTIAAVNEYGTEDGRIPSRPFLRTAMADRRIAGTAAKEITAYYTGKRDLETALNRLGAVAQGAVQRRIGSNIQPANAASTVKQKGSSKTLIDTGRLRQSIAWAVRHGAEAQAESVDLNSVTAGTGLSKAETNSAKRQARTKARIAKARARFISKVEKKANRFSKKVKRTAIKARKKTTKFVKKQSGSVKRSFNRATKKFSKRFTKGRKR